MQNEGFVGDESREIALACGIDPTKWQRLLRHAGLLECNPLDLALGEGLVSETHLMREVASRIGVLFSDEPPWPSQKTRSEEAFAMGFYPALDANGRRVRVVAPRGSQLLILLEKSRQGPLPDLVLTTRQVLLDRLIEADADRIARKAILTLPEERSARPPVPYDEPAMSAATVPRSSRRLIPVALALAALAAAAVAFPVEVWVIIPLVLTPVFVIAGISALTATLESGREPLSTPPQVTAHLPSYSILVPLYREARIAGSLVRHLSALIYPRDRIEALLLVEQDDTETLEALRRLERPNWIRIITVPDGSPRTKPRALNVALPFCSGDLLVVFDAEDAPDPDQLLRAAALFKATPPDVACAQARLAISNPQDGFLTRRFAIDYAILFDCVKAGSARAGWAVPLGGSSNHFRTSILRQVGGWDAWNVTEDADLGIRLARFGWLVEDLRSTTWEEAPHAFGAWMNQRTRWMKGWMQTLLVHLREPAQLVAGLGAFRAMIIISTGIAVLLGALLYPVFLGAIALRFTSPVALGSGSALYAAADAALVLALTVAVLIELIPAVIAIKRRRAFFLLPWVLLAPVSHVLISVAAWRGLIELFRRPFHWHKTEHGLAKREGGLSPLHFKQNESERSR